MRFAAASVALFAGAALASYAQYPEETVTSTAHVTVTSCPPEVPECPGTVHPEPTATDDYSSVYPIPTPTDVSPVYPSSEEAPVYPTDVSPVYPSSDVSPVYPSSEPAPPYPVAPSYSTSVVTYTTCIPTVTSSTITFYPTSTKAPIGTVTSVPVYPPKPTGEQPPFTGAASSFGASFAVAGVAAIAAFFLA